MTYTQILNGLKKANKAASEAFCPLGAVITARSGRTVSSPGYKEAQGTLKRLTLKQYESIADKWDTGDTKDELLSIKNTVNAGFGDDLRAFVRDARRGQKTLKVTKLNWLGY